MVSGSASAYIEKMLTRLGLTLSIITGPAKLSRCPRSRACTIRC